jgi:hypothetical protein
MARRFPKTAELWEFAESRIESYNTAGGTGGSKWTTVGLVIVIAGMALFQTAFGTVGTAFVSIQNPDNDTSVGDAFHQFLQTYR